MKTTTIFLLFFGISLICKSQNVYQKTYGFNGLQECFQHIQTSDNGFVMIGESITGSCLTIFDIIYMKTDSIGNFKWIKMLAGTNPSRGFSVCETNNNDLVFTGVTEDSTGNSNVLLFKTNSSGDTLWTRTYGDFNNVSSDENGNKVLQTLDGGYIILGKTNGPGNAKIFILKTDNNGNFQWAKTYGNSNYVYPNWIEKTNDSGFIIAGTLGISSGENNMFLIKTNSFGDTLWTKTYGEIDLCRGSCVRQTIDNGFILLGSNGYVNNLSPKDIYLIKTDTLGNVKWAKTYGDTGDQIESCISSTSDGGFIITGTTNSFDGGVVNIYTIRINQDGDTLWTKAYGDIDQDASLSVFQTSDRGFSIAGFTKNSDRDIYLIKTDSLGHSGCNEFNTNTIVNNQTPYIHSSLLTTANITANWEQPTFLLSTPNIICTTICEESSINENESSNIDINVYPNPFNNFVTFDFSKLKTSELELTIYNTIGEIVKYYHAPINEKIYLSKYEISQGVFFYVIRNKGILINSGKLVSY